MRNVLALGAAVLFIGSVGVVGAQERLPQSSSGSGFGVGAGVGDVSGSSGRTQAFDRNAFIDRLGQAETVYGRVLAIDVPGYKLHLETGGSSHDEGRAGTGATDSPAATSTAAATARINPRICHPLLAIWSPKPSSSESHHRDGPEAKND